MNSLEAFILGLIQGLTEYLPVSSSGHLVLAEHLFGMQPGAENLSFIVLLHAATALSSLVIFWSYIRDIFKGLLEFKWNESYVLTAKFALSAVPVVILGLFFEDQINSLFSGSVLLVSCMLIITGLLLLLTMVVKSHKNEISFGRALIIGITQAIAVLPGISRSGATIATSLLLGIEKEKAARFSFLMVIIPILGKSALDILKMLKGEQGEALASNVAAGGAEAGAFPMVGLLACRFMLDLVKKGKIYYFSFYCFFVGIIGILYGLGLFGGL